MSCLWRLPLCLLALGLARPAAAQLASGSYVGDGASGHRISSVGFRSDFVVIKGGSEEAILASSTAPPNAAKRAVTSRVLEANLVVSLDADGFTVGADGNTNAAGF